MKLNTIWRYFWKPYHQTQIIRYLGNKPPFLNISQRPIRFIKSLLFTSEKAMAPHSSTLAWKIPWAEEPGRLQSTGSLRVGHDWATSLSLFTFMHWRRTWQPTPVFLPGESQGRGSLWAAVYGVTQSQTRLKRLSSSSSSHNCYVNILPSGPLWIENFLKQSILREKKPIVW